MDHSMPAQTHVLKLNCAKCQRKAKKLLPRLNGVYSIKVDADAGKVIIKSTIHPDTLAAAIGEIMKGQDISCEPLTSPPNNNNAHVWQWINNMPMPPAAAANNGNAHCQNQLKGADLHELARVPRVKELEFTQTRNIKMTFNDEKESGPSRPPSEPNNDFIACDLSEAGLSRPTEEPKKVSGPNDISACDSSECQSHEKAQQEHKKCVHGDCHELRYWPCITEVVVNHSGPYYYTLPYYYPYNVYHPQPSYYGHPPPMLPRNNGALMHCDYVPKCRTV